MEEEALSATLSCTTVAMEQVKHFSHEHLLSLVQFQTTDHSISNENSDKEDEDKDDIVVADRHVGKCKMCEEEIYSFHLCYYSCKDCDYSLHKLCTQLPTTQQNHPLHPGHNLTLSKGFQLSDPDFKFVKKVDSEWKCNICSITRKNFYNYHCYICKYTMDIICATMSEQKMDHPSHHHQLQRYFSRMISLCYACDEDHSGSFYHCTTCSWFRIHLDCALLPPKLLIQQSTKDSFNHPHLLTLAYSFPYIELKAKFFSRCRVCNAGFLFHNKWHYRCNKCRYYVHVDCATSRREAFLSSILMPAGLGKTYKNFKDEDHPNLIHYPFPDEDLNILKHHFINKGELLIKGKIDGQMFSHPHPLILLENGSVSFHDPMKKEELLCNGCVRPITTLPFYKCSQHDCGFVLHEWCTRLPSEIQHHHDHPKLKLVLRPKVPRKFFGVFRCELCKLPSNGFAYGCEQCKYYVDVHCAFIPDVITHEAHPNHLLLRCKSSADQSKRACKACKCYMGKQLGFHCPACDFYLHIRCALLLPRTIKHKYDKHPLSLRYYPAENHSSEYFCEICEDEFNPTWWFYHCSTCSTSMHTACAPLKLHCEQSTTFKFKNIRVFPYINVKFGGTHEISIHPHPVTFVQGINDDGQCIECDEPLQYFMIFKCFQCKFALHS
ncbi:hypothetical protein L1987_51119 [Smallanthus sonchifolius]|uniref:Uncharacterized protein n=1 Tax=Smallanthus sonchifolius TaxID=185202 RepID=A0ACB9EPS1_9ASTR|nr:hypothetical protein L1987_51119 [Smallanthus sonchifolius]